MVILEDWHKIIADQKMVTSARKKSLNGIGQLALFKHCFSTLTAF
jgi:hypothetical protein